MNTRLTRLEAAMDGLKRIQDFTLVSVLGVGAIVVTLSVFSLQRFDQLSDRVDQLSGRLDQLSGRLDQLSGRFDQLSDRVDQLSEKVNEMPSKISAELRDITKTLAQNITAAKQQPPQVILVPSLPQQKQDGQ